MSLPALWRSKLTFELRLCVVAIRGSSLGIFMFVDSPEATSYLPKVGKGGFKAWPGSGSSYQWL